MGRRSPETEVASNELTSLIILTQAIMKRREDMAMNIPVSLKIGK
jgi:hypothetical protein